MNNFSHGYLNKISSLFIIKAACLAGFIPCINNCVSLTMRKYL